MLRALTPGLLFFLTLALPVFADEGAWKTAYYKRGFGGVVDAGGFGGLGATQRMRTPLGFGGTKARVYVRGPHEVGTELTKMALVRGADDMGTIAGNPFPVLFKGQPGLVLEKGLRTATSDEIPIEATPGTWYVEDQYASAKFPYAYEVDRGFYAPGDAFTTKKMTKSSAVRTGVAYRVDVFTTDPRSSILCFGDSITHGVGSTPNTGTRYPSHLGKLLKRPVLNLGQNSDVASQNKYLGAMLKELKGVDTVIFLMGINDIVLGSSVKTVRDYADVVKQIISDCHHNGWKIYIGTILPAGGQPQFDRKPEREALRKEFNAWIEKGNGADGVIDFAAAVADPDKPSAMCEDCQSDRIHPSDLGYQKMAEAAAAVLAGK